MKKNILLLALLISTAAQAQSTITWHYAADGVDPGWGWDYKDVVVPPGFRVDSVFGGFQRPTSPPQSHDYICHFSPEAAYNDTNMTGAWSYAAIDSSLYGHWIDLTSMQFDGTGVVRVAIPSPTATWDSLGIAMSQLEDTTTIDETAAVEQQELEQLKIFPNPATTYLTIENAQPLVIYSAAGQLVYENSEPSGELHIDISNFNQGMYFIREENSRVTKFIKQ